MHRNTPYLSCHISIGTNSPSAKKSNTNSPSSSPNRSTHKKYSSPPTRSNPPIPQTPPTPTTPKKLQHTPPLPPPQPFHTQNILLPTTKVKPLNPTNLPTPQISKPLPR